MSNYFILGGLWILYTDVAYVMKLLLLNLIKIWHSIFILIDFNSSLLENNKNNLTALKSN